jgi:hypothetical protein|nr:MAG TPA: hypothetical protein [Caudoviricetes sp.]DAX80139.1 MAG TPA: hypothetical protein [Caudoviricetes sp.]DAX81121.1 MAG TPA: hypothetical protein [Caudoviricetes sp.]
MPNLHSTVINRNLPAWLSGETANFEAQSLTLKATDFAEVIKKYNGVPSGYPVTIAQNKITPATADPDGFILYDSTNTFSEEQVAVIVKGIIILKRLPKLASGDALAKPASSAHFVYMEGAAN